MTVGDRIKRGRISVGLSQTELAERIGVSKQTLYKYENNIITNIPSDKIKDLARILGITPSILMGWEEREKNTAGADGSHKDLDIRRIERARKNMTPKDRDRMMRMLEAAFDEYFDDSFSDTDKDE